MRYRLLAFVALALACGSNEVASADKAGKRQAEADADAGKVVEQPVEPAPTGTAYFSPDAAEPYFGAGVTADAAAHFAIEDWQAARDAFAAHLESKDAPADEAGKARVAYLIAICDTHLDRWAEAAAGFDRATVALPLLADYSNYEAARAWYFAKDFDKAADRAAKVTAGSLVEMDARLLAGDLLRATGKPAAIAAHYAKYVADFPAGIRLAEARYRLAEAYEQLKQKTKGVPDALPLYRQITIEDPLGPWAAQAEARVAALVKTVKKKQRAAFTTLTGDEHITRGKVYFEAMRSPESEAEFRAALKAGGLTPAAECDARYHLGQSVFKKRTRCVAAPLLEEAAAFCDKIGDADKAMRAQYQAGRGYLYCYDNPGYVNAAAALEKAEQMHPEHSMADDARIRRAEAYSRMTPQTSEHEAKVEELLSTVPTLYPDGDMRAEAMWRLAFREWRADKYEAMIGWLDKQIAAMPHDDNWFGEGQAQYWKGRAYEQLGDKKQAVAAWEACVREYPLSYYSLHALNRLRESHEDAFKKLTAELKKPPKGWKKGTAAFTFKPRAVYAEPGFARALELLKLGLGLAAEAELTKLGLAVPKEGGGRKKVTDADKAEQLWAVALLYDRARRYDKSHWIARWSVLDYKTAWPTDANRARWDIAYPKAFWHLLEPAAAAQGYPTELLIAHVREESAFDPLRESYANAIGLTQMINSTGTRFAKGLGFDASRENLRDPAKNIAVGSRFLAHLWKLFHGRPALTVPAYNAGEGAVWKWLCDRGTSWSQDEWAEAITADEARGYSKRVLNSYFIYSYLKDGTIPVVPNDIPANVINQKKCKK